MMKKFKKLLATLLVALMALSLIPGAAFAASYDPTAEDEYTADGNVWSPRVQKQVIVSSDAQVIPDFTFTLKYTGANLTDDENVGSYDPSTPVVVNNPNIDLSMTGITTTVTGDSLKETIADKQNTSEFVPKVFENQIQFNSPGTYHFTLTEQEVQPFVGSPSSVDVIVVVGVNGDGNPSILQVTYQSAGSTIKTDAAKFTNTTANGLQRFEFTKTVGGNAWNSSDAFTFKITLDGATSGTYKVYQTGVNSPVATLTPENNVADSIIVTGLTSSSTASFYTDPLPAGASITVVETNKAGYTLSATDLNNAEEVTDENDETVVNGVKGTIRQGQTSRAALNNTINAAPSTGYLLSKLPYVALVAFAGVAVALIVKRRNHSEF